jgi:hypothetical protein
VGEEVWLLLIQDLGTRLGEWSASRPGRALPPGKGPPVPTVQEAGTRLYVPVNRRDPCQRMCTNRASNRVPLEQKTMSLILSVMYNTSKLPVNNDGKI